MSKPLVVSIPHGLGREEAVRRLRSGLASAKGQFGGVLQVQQEDWSGDRCTFRIGALGQQASGTIDVDTDRVRLEVELPWLLARLAEKARAAIEKQGHLMLDKPAPTASGPTRA